MHNAIQIIEHYHTFASTPYIKDSGMAAIGYGRTSGTMHPTTRYTELQYLIEKVHIIELFINERVKVSLQPCQVDALASLIFDVGREQFMISHLYRYLNQGRLDKASDAFLDNVPKSKIRRRMSEAILFEGDELLLF